MPQPVYPSVPEALADESQHRRQIARVLNNVLQGKQNVTVVVTLTANTTTTAIADPRVSAFSCILLMPTTANAAGALGTTYVSARATGSATLTHANAATTDRTFLALIIG